MLDVSGTAENDASFAKGMELHKTRLDASGRKVGKAEYHTPQSQMIMDTGAGREVGSWQGRGGGREGQSGSHR